MKKVLLIILCLCLLCGGCAGSGTSPAEILTIASQTAVLKTAAEDGTLLLERSFPRYDLGPAEDPIAKAIEADLQRRIESWMAASADLPEYALEQYSPEKPWVSWFAKLEGHTKQLDSEVLSLYFEYSEFAGGNHPNVATDSVTYCCKTGKVLELADILTDSFAPIGFISAVNHALAPQTDVLYDDYEALVGKAFTDGDIHWYLSAEGLCFHFAPYAIGPYSAGVITATIPYSDLSEVLRQEYIPSKSEVDK